MVAVGNENPQCSELRLDADEDRGEAFRITNLEGWRVGTSVPQERARSKPPSRHAEKDNPGQGQEDNLRARGGSFTLDLETSVVGSGVDVRPRH